MSPQERIRFGAPAAPANNGTVTLFDSTVYLRGGLSNNNIRRVIISFPGLDQASATGGLIGYQSPDKGTTWNPFKFGLSTMPATVPIDDGTDSTSYNFLVSECEDVKFTFTAGAAAPTVWKPGIYAQVGNVQSGV